MEKRMNPCKRMMVHAIGIDQYGSVEYATNGNLSDCKNIPGECGCLHAEDNLLKKMPNPVYVSLSHAPCFNCATLLIKAGVTSVSYLKSYRLPHGVYHLEINGVHVIDLSTN